jgi:hypothetical protein
MRAFWNFRSRNPIDSKEGSLLIAIGHALENVSEGSRDDESHALYCNKLVRKCLDKSAIPYEDYRAWRKVNRSIFTTIVDKDNTLIGFFDIFPITPDAGEGIIAGSLTERSLDLSHLLPLAANSSATHIHVATILLNPKQATFSPVVAKEILLLKLKEFMERNYAPIETRTYTAFGQSKQGEALLKRCGFALAVLPGNNDQGTSLYVLRPADTATAAFRFDRADEFFSRIRKGQTGLRELDLRIAAIELQLRAIVVSALDGDVARLPPHVQQKADERIKDAASKNAAFDKSRYKILSGRLEFCDLRELQDTILSKALWGAFQSRFANRETLSAKFSQLADLRNPIRHSRTVDEITQKEGEAGILWFERVLQK